MQGNKSVSNGSPIGQNEPVTVQEQLPNCHWLSHTTERTRRRRDQDNQHGLKSYIAIFWCKYLTQRLRLALVRTCWRGLVLAPALSARVSYLEEASRQHWPTSSAKTLNCHTCSAGGKIRCVITKYKKCDIILCMFLFYGTTTSRIESIRWCRDEDYTYLKQITAKNYTYIGFYNI
jgi:hypothetical protein